PGPQGAPGVEDSARAPPGSGWLRQLRSLGLLRAGFTAIGATVCDEADLELLARHGASVVSCPQADLRLGARVPVVARGVDRGALGTDSPAAAGALDVLTEARTAALVCGVDAAQALRMATLGGAAAGFWDPQGEFRPLHLINPVRLEFIAERARLAHQRVLDVGCGGGLLAEALARAGARVTAIDLAPGMIEVARLHAADGSLAID